MMHMSVWFTIGKGLRLDVQDTHELQSVQGLHDRLFDSHGRRIPDCSCENCIKVGCCTTSTSLWDTDKILIVQLLIFRYDPMNNRIRKLIPNLRIIWKIKYGILWYESPNASSAHYTCLFRVKDK